MPSLSNYAFLGVEFIGTVGVFLLLGWWLDRRFNPGGGPWCMLAGLAAGFAAGMYRMVRVLRVRGGGQ